MQSMFLLSARDINLVPIAYKLRTFRPVISQCWAKAPLYIDCQIFYIPTYLFAFCKHCHPVLYTQLPH